MVGLLVKNTLKRMGEEVRFEILSWHLSGWKDECHIYLETG